MRSNSLQTPLLHNAKAHARTENPPRLKRKLAYPPTSARSIRPSIRFRKLLQVAPKSGLSAAAATAGYSRYVDIVTNQYQSAVYPPLLRRRRRHTRTLTNTQSLLVCNRNQFSVSCGPTESMQNFAPYQTHPVCGEFLASSLLPNNHFDEQTHRHTNTCANVHTDTCVWRDYPV